MDRIAIRRPQFRKYPGTRLSCSDARLGIGADTAIFVSSRRCCSPLPYGNGAPRRGEAEQMRIGVDNAGMSPKEPPAIARRPRRSTPSSAPPDVVQPARQRDASRVTTGVVAEFLRSDGHSSRHGRAFRAEDDAKDACGAGPVTPIGRTRWAATKVIGRTFQMNDRAHRRRRSPPVHQPGGAQQDNDVYMPTSACPFRQRPAVVTGQTGMDGQHDRPVEAGHHARARREIWPCRQPAAERVRVEVSDVRHEHRIHRDGDARQGRADAAGAPDDSRAVRHDRVRAAARLRERRQPHACAPGRTRAG